MVLRSPKTKEEFNAYYSLRWEILRAPWDQPKGSEKDEYENAAFHIGAYVQNELVGVGRIHPTNDAEAQIRYMAVGPEYQGKGIGQAILKKLELHAMETGIDSIELNARNTAVSFYEKQGYIYIESGHLLYGVIEHMRMQKKLNINSANIDK